MDFDEKIIVVTGASGFIGSGVIRYLNDKGFSNLVIVDDLKCTDKWKNLVGKKFKKILSKKDLFHWLKGREKEINSFIHLGACSNTLEKDADYLLENNTHFTIRLAEYALKNDLRFIYASSAATYGLGENGFSDNHELLEDLKPLNMYGFSKHLFDLWAKRENVLDKVVGLKYFNVFGPNEYHKGPMASMIYKMTNKVQAEGKIQLFKSNSSLYKDGEQVRDFIYVKDAVKMTCDFLENSASGIFNIGRGEAVSWNHLAASLFAALNKKPKIEYVDMPEKLSLQYQNYTMAEMDKYNRIIGLQTESIEDSVSDYVQYLLKEKRW